MPDDAGVVARELSHPPAGVEGLTSEEAARRLAPLLAAAALATLWSEPLKRGVDPRPSARGDQQIGGGAT